MGHGHTLSIACAFCHSVLCTNPHHPARINRRVCATEKVRSILLSCSCKQSSTTLRLFLKSPLVRIWMILPTNQVSCKHQPHRLRTKLQLHFTVCTADPNNAKLVSVTGYPAHTTRMTFLPACLLSLDWESLQIHITCKSLIDDELRLISS